MDELEIDVPIYSPRWGHDDTYTFTFNRDQLKIRLMPREALCTWIENHDPVWSGEPIERIFHNDHIYPPVIFQDLIAFAWKSWRNGDINDEQADAELQLLGIWLNSITRSKPNSDFWNIYF